MGLAEGGNKSIFTCRICKDNHMTAKCPYKDTCAPLRDSLLGIDKSTDDAPKDMDKNDAGKIASASSNNQGMPGSSSSVAGQNKGYVPPHRRGEMPMMLDSQKRQREENSIRISNLSEHVTEDEIQDLCKQFGNVARIYLAKEKFPEKGTQAKCKGFAFINYHKKDDAAKAIATLNGFGYDHLILNVEWAKPSGT